MADISLNLKYNDNGAENKVNSIVKALEKAESKDWKLKVNIDGSAVNHQFANMQRVGAAAIQGLKRAWSDYKSIIEAPLNLTGVNQLVSLLDKMEGSLLLNQISSNITSGFANSLERYDILQTYPKIIQNIGYSSQDASDSMDRLYQSVLGLPTAFGDIVNSAQYFTLILDDLEKGTDLAIAANNAFVASGATGQQVTAGMRQLQYIMEGTKLRSTQWYSLIRSMPIALREVGDALGYPDFKSFTEDLIGNKVASEDFIDTLIDVGLNSDKLGNLLESMKDRAVAALTNVRNAAMRMGEGWLTVLDKTLEKTGGKGLEDNIKGVSSIIDHIAEVGRNWIETHGPELQSLIDKFMAIRWDELIPKLFDSLTNIADTALDNIDEWLLKIPDILQDVRATFNAIDNSRLIKILDVLGTGLTSGAAAGFLAKLFGGASLFGGAGGAAIGSGAVAGGSLLSILFGGLGAVTYGAPFGQFAYEGVEHLSDVLSEEERLKRSNLDNNIRVLRNMTEEDRDYILNLMNEYQHVAHQARVDMYNASYENTKRYRWLTNELRSYGIDTYYYGNEYHVAPVDYDLYEKSQWFERAVRKMFPSSISKKLRNRAMEDIIANESPRAMQLYEDIIRLQKEYDNVTEKYNQRLSIIDERRARISALIDKLEKEGFKWEYKLSKDYAEVYGDPEGKKGKFFSERVSESFGGLFRNTLNDFGKVQEKLTPQISELHGKMVDAIENYDGSEADKSQLLETWASVLSGIDPSNETDVKRLETMITEGPDKLINTYLIPMVKSNESLNENRKLLQEAMMEALGLAGSETDAEEDEVLSDMAKDNRVTAIARVLLESIEDINKNYVPLIESGMIDFSNDVVKAIKEAVKRIDELELVARPNINILPEVFLRSPSGETAPADGSIGRTTKQLQRLVRQTMPLATGGFAPMGTDTIPAMLTPGEYVQRRAAVEHFGRVFMDRINALDLRGALRSLQIATPFSTGGFIRNETRNYRDNHAVVNQTFNNSSMNYGMRRANRFVRALG